MKWINFTLLIGIIGFLFWRNMQHQKNVKLNQAQMSELGKKFIDVKNDLAYTAIVYGKSFTNHENRVASMEKDLPKVIEAMVDVDKKQDREIELLKKFVSLEDGKLYTETIAETVKSLRYEVGSIVREVGKD